MPIKIYKINPSPPVRAVLMTAELLQLNYEPVDIDFFGGEHLTPEYREKNPLHTVPLLQDGEFLLADSHAIITYLISKYGAEKRATLYPNELSVRATIDSRLYFDTSILFPVIRRIVRAIRYAGEKEITAEQIKDMTDGYDILEKYLEKTKFVAADHLTIADVSIVASISSANALVPLDDKYTKVHGWWNLLKEEDFYKKANVPGLTVFETGMKSLLGQ